MRMSHRAMAGVLAIMVCGVSVLASTSALADADPQTAEELRQLRESVAELKTLITAQQARISALERQAVPVTAPMRNPDPVASGAVPPAPTRGINPSALPGQIGSAIPEIGMVGDVVATVTEKKADGEGNNRVSVRHLELVAGGYVDPYSRYDATVTFSDFEAADVEEAYLTRWGLPGDLKARFGRFFPRIGKAAATHRDSLESVDEPLVVQRYFGVEGLTRTGADLTRLFDGPWGTVLEPSVGILEGGVGDDGTMFGSSRNRPTVYSHLKAFKDLSEMSSLELGLTHLAGSKDNDATWEVNALGVDATYLHYVTPINKLKLQGELYVQNREEAFGLNADGDQVVAFDRHPWGAYLLADYRFAPRWSFGGRADHVRSVDTIASRHADQALSAWLTFYQSEFARWRLQYRHMDRASEKSEEAVFLQGTFALGTHKHQIQ